MITVGIVGGLLAGFWGGVLVERSRWVIGGIDDLLDE